MSEHADKKQKIDDELTNQRTNYILQRLFQSVVTTSSGCTYMYPVAISDTLKYILLPNSLSHDQRKLIMNYINFLFGNCINTFNFQLYYHHELPYFIYRVGVLCNICVRHNSFILSKKNIKCLIDSKPVCVFNVLGWNQITDYYHLMCDDQGIATLKSVMSLHFNLSPDIVNYIILFIKK